MANRSSNSRLLAIGFAVLVVGVVLVLVIIQNTDDEPAEPSPAAVAQDAAAEADEPDETSTPLTQEELSTARLPLPLDVPEGTEAMAVRVNFMRSVAAVPTAGDVVNLYRLPDASDGEESDAGAEDPDQPATPTAGLPEPGPDAEQVLTEVGVLAMTGPLPAANDGTLTVVLAVPTAEVAALMPVADAGELWLTLPPAPEGDGSTEQDATEPDTPTEGTTEEPS